MKDDIKAEWERFLDPKELRPNLILASLYIAAFEILKNSIIERIRDFYTHGFDENGWLIDPDYAQKVLSKDKSPIFASLKWLEESDAITEDDIRVFDKVKECRNLLAHEITKFLAKGLPPELPECFKEMYTLLNKIEKWWIIEVDIPTDPDLVEKIDEIDMDGIIPGPILSLKLMIEIALGPEETANSYLNEFKKNRGSG